MQLRPLDIVDGAVDAGGMDEQRCGREAIIVVLEVDRMLVALRHVGQKLAKAFEHASGTLHGWNRATLHGACPKSRAVSSRPVHVTRISCKGSSVAPTS